MNAEDELAGIGIDLGAQPPKVETALRFIVDNLSAPIDSADLAEVIGCGKRDVQKLFAPALGVSPFVVLKQLRLQRAHHLMRRSWRHIGVRNIAAAVGIRHPGEFAIQYREVYGESPSEMLARRPREPLHHPS